MTLRVLGAMIAAVSLGLFLALPPMPVEAHAGLDASDPEPNAIVAKAPASVTMTFTEPLERGYTRAELYDQDGNPVDGTSVAAGDTDKTMVLRLPATLPNGTYTVLWRTLSTADGHTAQNSFAFTIGTADDIAATAGPAEASAGPPLWLRAASRWAALLGLAGAVAAWPMWLLVVRPALAPARVVARTASRRMRWFTAIAVAVALLGDVFAIVVQAASLTDGSLLDRIRSTLGDTRYGELWYLRVGLLLALGLALQWVAWWWPRRHPLSTFLALGLSLAAATPFSYIAHASALGTGRGAAILADFLHIVSASLWTGGVMILGFVLAPIAARLDVSPRRRVLSRALPRFSSIALIAWSTLALTGLYAAWLQVGSSEALLETGYGRALLVKLALIAPILLLAAFNLFVVTSRLHAIALNPEGGSRWTTRFRYAVAAEALLAIAVLAAVGTLTAQAPAREAIASTPASIEVALTGGERDAELSISPGSPGPNRFTLTVGGEPMLHETEVLLRVESSARDTGEKDLRFVHGGGTEYTYEGSELSLAGAWDLQLIVRQPAAPEWRAFGIVELQPVNARASTGPSWVVGTGAGIAGMLLALLGIAAMVFAWQAIPARYRLRWLAVGAALVVLAAILLSISRTDGSVQVATALAGMG